MFFLRLFSRTPLPVLYLFADFLFFMAYRVVGYRRKMVRKNLNNSFPEKSESELNTIEKQFYKNLCDYGVETLKLLTISAEELKRRMVFKNPELVAELAKKNQSVLFLTAHQFNWEWVLTSGSLSLPFQIDFVYQRLSNKTFNEFSLQSRSRFGAHAIERSQVGREAIKRREILRGTAIMADQFPGHHHDKKHWTTFLHQRTAFFMGVSQLASITQYPALFLSVRKIRRGYYEGKFSPISVPPYEKESEKIVEEYAREVERAIQADPPSWLWSHNRWKDRK